MILPDQFLLLPLCKDSSGILGSSYLDCVVERGDARPNLATLAVKKALGLPATMGEGKTMSACHLFVTWCGVMGCSAVSIAQRGCAGALPSFFSFPEVKTN